MPSAFTTLAWLKGGLLGPLVEDLMMKFQGTTLECESSYGKKIISSYCMEVRVPWTPRPGKERVGQPLPVSACSWVKSIYTLLFELSILLKPCKSSVAGYFGTFFLHGELSYFLVILLVTSNYNKGHLN